MIREHADLDWPGVLALAGRFCATERGRERLHATRPASARDEAVALQELTAELRARRAIRIPVRLGGLDEGAPLLPRLVAKTLPAEDLLDLFVLAERSEDARRAVPVEGLDLPRLAAALAPLPDLEDLLGEREATFEPDGRVKDTASARLAALRASIARHRKEVVRRLEEYARAHGDALGDGYVTEKGGRYCLPVRTDRRDAVAGIVHEKSRSGQTLFVEPIAVVDANNALAEALEEEREEVTRLLTALTARFAARRSELAVAVAVLTDLDAAQARAEFSERVAGVAPAFEDRLVIRMGRHPLLDRRLAPLRAEVFGEAPARAGADAVPLELEMPAGKRLLVLSGPNAGGKTVVLKTVGLFALLAQSGFALPAGAGTSLPVFDRILSVSGDAQDLLGDLSSFEAAMTRTAAAFRAAGRKSLVLFDELGSGTDPDEGAALAVELLAYDLARGGFSIATTHLAAVKEWALENPAALAAAMEFDEGRGRPTYRVRPGATGRSRALAAAEKAGVPDAILAAAKGRLGDKWAKVDAALERLEAETRAAREEREAARRTAAEAADRLADAEREKSALASERARLKEKGKAEIDRALEAAREAIRRELDRLRSDVAAGRAVSRGALQTVTKTARDAAQLLFGPEEEPERGPVSVGERVRVVPYRTSGVLVALDGKGQAEVDAGGKRLRVSVEALAPERAAKAWRATASSGPAGASGAPRQILLVGQRVDAALPEVERAINDALLSGQSTLRIVHGHGTGRLGAAIREFLAEHPGVAAQRPGDATEGGAAVTIATLDV